MHIRISPKFALAAAFALPVGAQFTSPLCTGNTLSATDFSAQELFNKNGTSGAAANADLSEPTHMDVRVVKGADGKYDHSDIIFVERTGNVKWYDGAAKKVTLMGHISVHAIAGSEDDNGLMGVVFHPDFEKNRWVYLWYSPLATVDQTMTGTGQNRQLRLSRFVVKSDNTLDLTSEKILIKILGSKSDQWHSGGPMQFDAYGDLWGTMGNNSPDLDPTACSAGNNVMSKTDSTTSAEWGPSNTASFRGGFWRIHPDSSAKGYSIPKGNFGEYWGNYFEQKGHTALAAKYRDPAKVLPEVYVKGERSNFSCAVHPYKRWLAWGTVNYASTNDEFNITDHPIFSGFPYFHRDNQPTCTNGKNVDAPVNNSPFNSGVDTLPPAIAGSIVGLTNVAIGGPIYHFDRSIDYDGKMPPHLDNKWIVTGFNGGMWIATFDTTTMKVSGTPTKVDNGIFSGVPIRNHIQSMYGKDGALYILNYDGYYHSAINPGVVRVTYKGACKIPVGPDPAVTSVKPYQKIWIDPHGIMVGEEGPHTVSLYDLAGHRVWKDQGVGAHEYRLNELRSQASLKPGLYLARVRTSAGEYSRRLSLF
ncbi:MAG: PQQ-dependent sugar dehydrogenase [Fibrobacteres bacterium]|nr:PQQ-dependent sugar dehydrogenase [Fibrobacterota bacterium]